MKNFFFFLLCSFITVTCLGQTGSWNSMPAKGEPHSRHENALVAAGNKILLIGGRGDKLIDIYDVSTQTWSTGAQPPFEVHHLQAVELDGLVYALGGFTGSWPFETPLTHVLIYDLTEDKWALGPQIPVHRRRGAAGVVAHNSKIYLINGIINGHTSGWVSWLDEFDPYTNTWSELPDAPKARDHFQAAVIDDQIYIAGGRLSGSGENGFAGTFKDAYAFDLKNNTWTALPPLPTERAGTAAVAYNDTYIVIGGESENQEAAHSEVEAYDLQSKSWKTLPPLNNGRHGTQVVVINGELIIGAGSANRGGGPELNSFEMFSSKTGKQPNLSEQKPLLPEKLTTSTTSLKLDSNKSGSITIKNPSTNKAIFISNIQLNDSENFQVEQLLKNAFPLILAPGGEKTISVKTTSQNAKESSAILFIKTLGNSEPVQINISN